MNAMRSAIACTSICEASPSGIADIGAMRSDARRARAKVVSIPPVCLNVTEVGVSALMMPLTVLPSVSSATQSS
jgi:hypothetical protein